VNGLSYADHRAPLHEVGALLEAKAIHTGRTARNHLLSLAATHGISHRRVDEVLDVVGLTHVAGKRAGGFSLGMGQRLGIASALLGDPQTLILDEPVNGLDPDGIRWIRTQVKDLAAQGRTVLISSHLMSEMAVTAERLVVVGRGRLIADTSVDEFIAQAGGTTVLVRSPQAAALREAILVTEGASFDEAEPGVLHVTGLTVEAVGELAARRSITLHELTTVQLSLEDAFMSLTHDAVQFRGSITDERIGAAA
jgi:ABC-2 type transport system ATP-binding protein